MSTCIPNTPIASDIHHVTTETNTAGWHTITNVVVTSLSRYYGVTADVITFNNVFDTQQQSAIFNQLWLEETKSTGSMINPDLLIHFYTDGSPTAPSTSAVYEADTGGLVCSVRITAADWVYYVSSNIKRAVVNVDQYILSGAGNTGTNLYAVILSDKSTAMQFAGTPALRMKPVLTMGAR